MAAEFYDRQGREMTQNEWTAKFRDKAYKVVAYDRIGVSGDTVGVSTVWLGMNHAWGDAEPLIFETMVFDGSLDGECERYSTEADALAGHTAMCARVQAS